MRIINLLDIVIVLGMLFVSCNQQEITETKNSNQSELGGLYLGQNPPGTIPELFAQGIVSTELPERDFAISPDGKEIYFSILSGDRNKWRSTIVCCKQINGVWSKPEVASFSGQFMDIEPFIQHDGERMYFASDRPLEEGKKNKYNTNLWYLDKTENGWSNPKPVGEPINGQGSVFYPSITKSGTMYFTRRAEDNSELIYRSKNINGKFTEPELLPKEINISNAMFNTFISPDEDYLIVPTLIENDGCGSTDYYVSFRDENDNWSELINLGCEINSSSWDYAPSLSPDGKYLFFQKDRWSWSNDSVGREYNYEDLENIHKGQGDIYWVDASVIKSLNPFK